MVMPEPLDQSYYRVGGSLEYQHPTYMPRRADTDLYNALRQGEFCYVLNARQMGKSSLRVQTMKRLQYEGVRCATLDMTRIGYTTQALEWYGSLVSELIRGFGLGNQIEFQHWWQERSQLTPIQRLACFLDELLVLQGDAAVVIFLDEVDSVIGLPFKEELFRFLWSCYDQRSLNPAYQRLSFALFGVAAPSDLLADRRSSPFGVGQAIHLEGLRLEEMAPLLPGLVGRVDRPWAVLRAILDWTGGQPFLTQKLCSLVVTYGPFIPLGEERQWVEHHVQTHLLHQWEERDEPEHLRSIRDRLCLDRGEVAPALLAPLPPSLQVKSSQRSLELLHLYRQVLVRGNVPANQSLAQLLLRLCGVVRREGGRLKPFNPIYASIFNLDWVERELALVRRQIPWLIRLQQPIVALATLCTGMGLGAAVLSQTSFFPVQGDRLSYGEDILTPGVALPQKRLGVAALARKDYPQAISKLQQYLARRSLTDPEALIYLNNAHIGDRPSYTLAVSVPLLSNSLLDIAQEILQGVAQAQEEVNRSGGVAGKPLRILIANDEGDRVMAQRVARALGNDPAVMGVIGHYASRQTLGTLPIYRRRQLVLVSPTSTATVLRSPYFFRTLGNDQVSAGALSRYLVNTLKQRRVALYLSQTSVYGRSLAQAAQTSLEALGGTVVGRFELDDRAFNLEQAIAQTQQLGAEALWVIPDTSLGHDQILRAMDVLSARQGLTKLGGDSLYLPETLIFGQGHSEGLVLSLPLQLSPQQLSPQQLNPQQLNPQQLSPRDQPSAFAERARGLWQGSIGWRTISSYDATNALVAALGTAKTRPEVRQVLADPKFSAPGAFGVVKFDAKGDRHQMAQLVTVRRSPQSPFGYEFTLLNPVEATKNPQRSPGID